MKPSVYSNAAYPLAAIAAWGDPYAFGYSLTAGLMLMVASGAFHATGKRVWQRLDVATMLTYISVVLSAALSAYTMYAWLLPPLALAFYGTFAWQIDSHVHVPVWSVLTIVALFVRVGWWALLPAGLLALAAWVGTRGGVHSWQHALWHVLSATAAGTALGLL